MKLAGESSVYIMQRIFYYLVANFADEDLGMNILSTLFLLVLWVAGPVDKSVNPGDDRFHFEEFVAVDELSKEGLYRNALNFAGRMQVVSDRANKPDLNIKEGLVRKEGSFYVYKKGLLTPQIHGEIKFTLELAVKDQGYTYAYKDFVFHYYEKNRYGRYQPVSGKKKSLETEKFAGMQELWEAHKQTTRQHIQGHIRALKAHMAVVPPGAGVYDEHTVEEVN